MNNEIAKKYELMVIVDAKLNHDDKEAVFKEAREIVTKHGGKVVNSQVWLEKHKLAFNIKKCQEGTYYLINFETDGESNGKMRNILRLNERIIRFAFTQIDKFVTEPARN